MVVLNSSLLRNIACGDEEAVARIVAECVDVPFSKIAAVAGNSSGMRASTRNVEIYRREFAQLLVFFMLFSRITNSHV
jgi:hypothetical protein